MFDTASATPTISLNCLYQAAGTEDSCYFSTVKNSGQQLSFILFASTSVLRETRELLEVLYLHPPTIFLNKAERGGAELNTSIKLKSYSTESNRISIIASLPGTQV